MPKGKSRGKLKRTIAPIAPASNSAPKRKRNHSPGGTIVCANGHIVSRRRLNTALRFRQRPSCNMCGSTDLTINHPHVVRREGSHLMWAHKAKRRTKKDPNRREIAKTR